MNFFEYYYENIVKYDLLNKFQYKNVNQIPKFKKVILNFGCKKSDFKSLLCSLMALELITTQKAMFTYSSVPDVSFKVKKGNPVGCKITLRKTLMYVFFTRLVSEIFPKLKQFNGFKIKNINSEIKTISFKFKSSLIFPELENQYQYFNKLPCLNITIITNVTKLDELCFLLKSFKFPTTN
jgi:large subunit ribosomal protein L5